MDDGINIGVFGQDAADEGGVRNVALVVRIRPRELPEPFAVVVQDDGRDAIVCAACCDGRADVACAAGDENLHELSFCRMAAIVRRAPAKILDDAGWCVPSLAYRRPTQPLLNVWPGPAPENLGNYHIVELPPHM